MPGLVRCPPGNVQHRVDRGGTVSAFHRFNEIDLFAFFLHKVHDDPTASGTLLCDYFDATGQNYDQRHRVLVLRGIGSSSPECDQGLCRGALLAFQSIRMFIGRQKLVFTLSIAGRSAVPDEIPPRSNEAGDLKIMKRRRLHCLKVRRLRYIISKLRLAHGSHHTRECTRTYWKTKLFLFPGLACTIYERHLYPGRGEPGVTRSANENLAQPRCEYNTWG